jgi:hypothetical protein
VWRNEHVIANAVEYARRAPGRVFTVELALGQVT